MHATLVQLHIKIGDLADFLSAVKANHEASVQEPGNLRFDVLQSRVDPTRLLYEVYTSAKEAAAHRETAHYKEWNAGFPIGSRQSDRQRNTALYIRLRTRKS